MKISVLDSIKLLIVLNCLACSCDVRFVKPGHFTEQDIMKIGNIYYSYCYNSAFCNESVHNQQNERHIVSTTKICCDGCSCNLSACVESQQNINCCPELLNEIAPHFSSERCVHPQMKPVLANATRLVTAVLMISHCLRDTDKPADYIDKCERSESFTDIDTKIPVTVGNGTHSVTYKNQYCAVCNDVQTTEIRYWSPKLDCYRFNVDVTVTPLEQILEKQSSGNCLLYFTPPANVNKSFLQTCGEKIGECNATGQWKVYDPLIEAACQSFKSEFQNIYRNVFCFLCNTDNDNMDIPPCRLSEMAAVTFSLILKYVPTLDDTIQERTNETRNGCMNEEVYDSVQNKCLRIRCLMSSVYIDGDCKQVVEKMGGVVLNAFFKMTPLHKLVDTVYVEYAITTFVKDLLFKLHLQNTLEGLTVYNKRNTTLNALGRMDTLYFVAYFRLHLPASSFADKMVDRSAIDLLLKMHESNQTIWPYFDKNSLFTLFLEFETSDSIDKFDRNLNIYPALLPVLFCPLVGLNASFYHFEYNKDFLFIKEFDTEIKRNEYIKMDDSTIAICINTFILLQDRYKQIKQMQKSTYILQGNTTAGIVSLVFSSVSILCSCITLIVYMRIKSLHTQPGINTVCLTLSLVCAQSLFQFGIGQAKNIPSWACSLIGFLVHYFWIVTILWMNICTFHMFRIFRMLQNINFSRNLFKTTCLYWLYCGVVGLAPVIINMVVTYSKYGRIGYGGNICYITDYSMVGFCFALPAAAVIICNWFLFVTTVHRINSQPAVNKNRRDDKAFLVIYIKMSTLTGLTWTFGFIFFFINVAFLEYLFIIFNAGQGIFLFISFVCNERVWRLLFRPKSLDTDSTLRKTS